MKHFTVDAEDNITLHASRREAKGTGGAIFSTEAQFADTIGNDSKRLLEIWNSLPGIKPVTKFANRKAATERIWKAIQNLGGPAATELVTSFGAQVAEVAPSAAKATNEVPRTTKAAVIKPQARTNREGTIGYSRIKCFCPYPRS